MFSGFLLQSGLNKICLPGMLRPFGMGALSPLCSLGSDCSPLCSLCCTEGTLLPFIFHNLLFLHLASASFSQTLVTQMQVYLGRKTFVGTWEFHPLRDSWNSLACWRVWDVLHVRNLSKCVSYNFPFLIWPWNDLSQNTYHHLPEIVF